MIKYLYSIYDRLAKTYNDPIFMINDDVAKRGFGDECRNESSMLNRFPTDYTLFKVGSFDTSKGVIDSFEPVVVCRATDYVEV